MVVVGSQVVYPAPQDFTHLEKCFEPLERATTCSRWTDQDLWDIQIVVVDDLRAWGLGERFQELNLYRCN